MPRLLTGNWRADNIVSYTDFAANYTHVKKRSKGIGSKVKDEEPVNIWYIWSEWSRHFGPTNWCLIGLRSWLRNVTVCALK